MTHAQYAMYSRIFDALHDLHATGTDTLADIQLHGNAAGAALRTWAIGRRLDVVPDVGELPDHTWAQLRLTLPGEVSWLIMVHLDDKLSLAPPPIQTAADMEIPF